MKLPYKIKPAVSTVILFSLLPILFLILLTVSSIQEREINFLFLIIFLVVSATIYIWLSKTNVELNEDKIIISSILNTTLILLQKIEEVKIHIIPSNKSKYDMIITHSTLNQKNPAKINIKLYTKADLQFFANYLTEKNKYAKYDANVLNMKNGKMPSIIS